VTAKFQPGDLARVGGKGRPLPACYWWLKRGQIVRIQRVVGRIADGHLEYQLASRRGRPACVLASYDLRKLEERDRAKGAGRKAAERAQIALK